jgi:hypothetical protein
MSDSGTQTQRSEALRRFRQTREKVTRGLARLVSGGRWKNRSTVFLLSTGRSGTAALAKVLELAPGITAFHEPWPQMLEERQQALHEVWTATDSYGQLFLKARAGLIARSTLGGKVYAETSARLTFFAPAIAQVLPEARFIHLVRHPGDVIRSGMRRSWYSDNRSDRYRIRPQAGDPYFENWESLPRFEKICWYWNAYNSFALRFTDIVEARRFLLLKAEDLFAARGETLEQLFEFIGVPSPGSEALAAELDHKHNRQVKNDYPRFEEWNESQRKTLAAVAGDTMTALGYS